MMFMKYLSVVLCVLALCYSSDVSAQGSDDLRPVINEIRNLQIVKHANSRSLSCDVSYSGADHVTIQVEEDFSSVLRTTHVYEPFLAHIQVDHIVLHYAAWVDIIVSNEYGSVVETIELPPDYGQSGLMDVESESPAGGLIEIFSLDGRFIGKVSSIDDIYATLRPGIYIIRETDALHSVKIRKIVL